MTYKPKPFDLVTLEDGTQARRYADGSLRDSNGYPLPGTKIPGGFEITPDNARALLDRRRTLARQALEEGAAGYLEEKHGITATNADVLRVIGHGLIARADDPKNPKGVEAARLYLQETEQSVTTEQDQGAGFGGDLRDKIRELAKVGRVEIQLREAKITVNRED